MTSTPHSELDEAMAGLRAVAESMGMVSNVEAETILTYVAGLEEQLEAQRDLLQRIYDNERVWRVLPNSIAGDIFAALETSSPASRPE